MLGIDHYSSSIVHENSSSSCAALATFDQAYGAIVVRSGKRKTDLSRGLGKSPGYLGSSIAQGSMPSLDLFVRLANLCGWKVVLEGDDGQVELTPTESD